MLCIIITFALKAELSPNSTLISDLKIQIDDPVDYTRNFPDFLNISFSEFGNYFHVEFIKTLKIGNGLKSSSQDIYVIDDASQEPVKYGLDNESV
jgi:hypothetical protein